MVNSTGYFDEDELIFQNEIDIEKKRLAEFDDWHLIDKDFIYKNTTLKQASFTNLGNKSIIHFINRMKKQGIEVPSPRFLYYITAINREKGVSNRMELVDHFDPNKHRIDKYHYLKGVKSILSVELSISEKEVEKILKDLISKYTNDVIYVCLDTGNVMNSFPRDLKNSNLIYKGYTDVNFASQISVKLVSFFNKLKENREKKDLEYFYVYVKQQIKNKLLGKTTVAIYRLDLKLEKSDVTLIDRVEDDNPNTNSLYLSYDLIKRSI
ncbi:13483_t:CDS:2, partial [Dentiscutata heterogama]